MGWLKQVLGRKAPELCAKIASQTGEPQLPLGLTLGSHVSLNAALKSLLEGESDIIVPSDDKIMAIGTLEAGSGYRLIRCYLDNEHFYIQFLMSGPREDDIAALILFGYHEVRTLCSPTELLHLTGPGAKIGMPFYELERTEYVRQWGTEDGQAEMTALTERVINTEGSYTVHHRCALYARNLRLANRREFLLLSMETDELTNRLLTTAVGVTLQLSDLSIV